MPFLTLNGTTIRVQSNAIGLKFDEHGLDRERMFDGSMRQIRRGIYRRWEGNSAILTESDANALIALLTSEDIPLSLSGDLVPDETVPVMPVLLSNDPIHTASGFKRRIVFTLHESPAPAVPGIPPGLRFWYNYAANEQYTDAGITSASSNGDEVQQWNDQSGNELHATQADSTKPVVSTGNAAIKFEGSVGGAHWLQLPDVFNGATEGELLFRVKIDNQFGVTSGPWVFASATGGGSDSQYAYIDGSVNEISLSTTRRSPGYIAALTRWRVYGVRSSDAYTLSIDGIDVYTDASNTFDSSTAPKLGISTQPNNWEAVGYLRQAKGWSRILTPTERAAEVAAMQLDITIPTSARYFRMLVTRVWGGGDFACTEIEVRETPLGPDLAPGATITASSTIGGSSVADLVDGNGATCWIGALGSFTIDGASLVGAAYLDFDFGSAKSITEVKFKARFDGVRDDPKEIAFLASSNGTDWVYLNWDYLPSNSLVAAWSASEVRTFTKP